MTTYLTTRQVISIHDTESPMPIRDHGVLDAAVSAPRATWGGELLRPDLLTQTAALLIGICQAQAFVDGNKRTAWISTDVFLQLNGASIDDLATDEILAVMDSISTGALDEAGLAEWLDIRTSPRPSGNRRRSPGGPQPERHPA